MDDKQDMLNNYDHLLSNVEKFLYISFYLKHIIDNIKDEESEDFVYVFRKLEELSVIYSLSDDVLFRFKREINRMLSSLNLELPELNISEHINILKEKIEIINKTKSA